MIYSVSLYYLYLYLYLCIYKVLPQYIQSPVPAPSEQNQHIPTTLLEAQT